MCVVCTMQCDGKLVMQTADTDSKPSSRQATDAERSSKSWSHTVPHCPLCRTSSRPSLALPPTSLIATDNSSSTSALWHDMRAHMGRYCGDDSLGLTLAYHSIQQQVIYETSVPIYSQSLSFVLHNLYCIKHHHFKVLSCSEIIPKNKALQKTKNRSSLCTINLGARHSRMLEKQQ